MAAPRHTRDEEPCSVRVVRHDHGSIAPARRTMVDELLEFGVDRQTLVDAETVLGELMANAVEHGTPLATVPAGPRAGDVFEVGWCVVGPVLRLSVVDGGLDSETLPAALDTESLRGRGLQLVDTLCDRWVADLVAGTRVTAELRIAD